MKGVFVIMDGVSDEPCYKLKDKTPLEYARTPNLDFFTQRGDVFGCNPIAEGIAPQSSSGIVSLLGADFRDYPRGVIEAIGFGISLNNGDLALRCNFATIEGLDSLKLVDRRAGRTLTTKEANSLATSINSNLKLPFKFELIPTMGHRAILVFRGALSANITNIDPSYDSGLSVEGVKEIVRLSSPTDDSSKAKLTADLINTFVRKSYVILENHPVNIARKKKGYFPANFLLCRDAGTGNIKTKNLAGLWMGFGYMPLEIGIAKIFGMRISSFKPLKMEKEDFYEYSESVLDTAIKKSIEMLEDQKGLVDYFYIHFKETDLPGHDNKPLQKVKFIEMIDKDFFGYLRKINLDFKLVVTADHTTSCRAKGHTSSPVPVLYYNPSNIKESKLRFIESSYSKRDLISGRQLLSKTLLSK